MENGEVKEAAVKYNYYPIEDYLVAERASTGNRYELHEGYLFRMQGASMSHARVVRNLVTSIDNFLKDGDKRCEVLGNDLKVAIKQIDSVFYPDLTIICNDPEFYDEHKDVLLTPNVIIEVLSESTASYDRGHKFFNYRQLESFREYILIDSASQYIYTSRKQPNAEWLSSETNDPIASLHIETIDFTLPIKEIYRGLSF